MGFLPDFSDPPKKGRGEGWAEHVWDVLVWLGGAALVILGFFGVLLPKIAAAGLFAAGNLGLMFSAGLMALGGWMQSSSDEPIERLLWLVLLLVGSMMLLGALMGGV